jgi:hypothetical protein
MIKFTPHLRTDEEYQDGWLREDLEKVEIVDSISGRKLELDAAIIGEILNSLEYGVNEASPSCPKGHSSNLTLNIPFGGVRFDQEPWHYTEDPA